MRAKAHHVRCALALRFRSDFSAEEEIRTLMPLQALRPERTASTSFATSAACANYMFCLNRLQRFFSETDFLFYRTTLARTFADKHHHASTWKLQ